MPCGVAAGCWLPPCSLARALALSRSLRIMTLRWTPPVLCRICEFPVADSGVRVDAEKLTKWWRCTLDAKFEITTGAEAEDICQVCVWEARWEILRLASDNLLMISMSKNLLNVGEKAAFIFLATYKDSHLLKNIIFSKSVIVLFIQCWGVWIIGLLSMFCQFYKTQFITDKPRGQRECEKYT